MKLILLIFSICQMTVIISQTSSYTLDYNSVSALLNDEGLLFQNEITHQAEYEVPKGGGINSIYSLSFWCAGQDENGILRAACARYNSGHDFFSGPISSNAMYEDPLYISNYSNAIWTVSKTEVDAHIQNYLQSGYITPASILSWPGNGIASLGVSQNLAPFMDVNGDNLYTPSSGDFPLIRGDKASYIIVNDMDSIHTETSGEQMGIEMHMMVYQYASNNFIDTTTFLNVRIFNKGIHTYDNFKIAVYMDGDLGNFSDDYVGCDTMKNLIYTYNGDNFDENNGAAPGYGTNPPCIGVVSLNNPMNVAGYYSNSTLYPYTDPSMASEYWNYMNGSWANGYEWFYGGMGYAGSVGVTNSPTNFLFSGNPYTGIGWSELTNNNYSGDRRNFMTLDSVILNPTQEKCYDFAIIYNRQGNNLENVQGVIDLADSVKQFFDDQMEYNCLQVVAGIEENSKEEFKVFPNPSNGQFTFIPNENWNNFSIEITDLSGRIILSERYSSNASVQINLNNKQGMFLITAVVEGQKYDSRIVVNL